MNRNIAIKVKHLTKIYKLYDKPIDRLKESLHPLRKKYSKEFHALSDLSFEIKKGETVGIIGKNGSGKSTLLKMLTGVITPTSGSMVVHGKIAAILELGAGFNPDMTGLENVYLNTSINGMSKEETDVIIENIINFAEIGEFINQPMKTYSSGMQARLAFSVSINVNPDILIVDEALSVGDMNFQAKCMTAMDRIKQKGTTILFVSHDINSVKSLCSRAIYMKKGKMIDIGKASVMAELYIKDMRESINREYKKSSDSLQQKRDKNRITKRVSSDVEFKTSDKFDKRVEQYRYGTGELKTRFVELLDMEDNPLTHIDFNQEVKIRIYAESYSNNDNVVIGFKIVDDKKINIVAGGFQQIGEEYLSIENGKRYIVEYKLKLPLQKSTFSIDIGAGMFLNPSSMSPVIMDSVADAIVFSVGVKDIYPIWSKVDLFPTVEVTKV
ncbi:MAG: ABC transporter ATP-binding protein [Sulfurimonas sp.]|nr:ABC transporter ATP-binding protein [Sulfurimonas sp.]